MNTSDFLALIHPVIAIIFVFPLLGIVTNRAWLTRQRRLENLAENKSKIPPIVGKEHVELGRWLSSAVVGLSLIGLAYPIGNNILKEQLWQKNIFQVVFILIMFVLTIVSLVMLHKAKPKHWRAVFATLTGMGLIILGCQEGVYRRTGEWYWSHYYYGIVASLLMIFSLAIIQDIYSDKSNRWRIAHITLNCFALLLFLGQGMTGTRDLLEIPLSWQQPYIYRCDWNNKTCPNN
jgi:peptidoglycan/LPS O-acetylase OafA/YrhL